MATQLRIDFGITPEQACTLCHLSANCGGCCKFCQSKGGICNNSAQECSQVNLESQGLRWNTWMYLVRTKLTELRRFIPRRYWHQLNLTNH